MRKFYFLHYFIIFLILAVQIRSDSNKCVSETSVLLANSTKFKESQKDLIKSLSPNSTAAIASPGSAFTPVTIANNRISTNSVLNHISANSSILLPIPITVLGSVIVLSSVFYYFKFFKK